MASEGEPGADWEWLRPVAGTATALLLLLSPILAVHCPSAVNALYGLVVASALAVYSLLSGTPLLQLPAKLAAIVLFPSHVPTSTRWGLLLLWLAMLIVSVAFAVAVSSVVGTSNSRLRKFFHLTLSVVYLSGCLVDPWFLELSCFLLLCIFILLEQLRYLSVPPWANALNEHLLVFKDEQDDEWLLTPLFLLGGMSMPLLLLSPSLPPDLSHFSGLLAVGVGDSAAALVGSLCGKHFWIKEKRKSIEGSTAFFLSCLLCSLLLRPLCSSPSPSFLSLILASSILSLVEAFLPLFDNLLLPILAFFLFNFLP